MCILLSYFITVTFFNRFHNASLTWDITLTFKFCSLTDDYCEICELRDKVVSQEEYMYVNRIGTCHRYIHKYWACQSSSTNSAHNELWSMSANFLCLCSKSWFLLLWCAWVREHKLHASGFVANPKPSLSVCLSSLLSSCSLLSCSVM